MIEVIAGGKGLIPYEKKQSRLGLKPEHGICFQKSEFYSFLKQKVVTYEDYKNWNFLIQHCKWGI